MMKLYYNPKPLKQNVNNINKRMPFKSHEIKSSSLESDPAQVLK